jgi:glycosyltransferase involved in cell wall biosynthesis
MQIHTLEPLVVYLGRGYQGVYVRGQASIPTDLRRNYAPFFTLPAATWLGLGSRLRRFLFMIVEPVLLAIDVFILNAKLASVVKRNRPDILISNGPPDLCGVVTRMISSIFNVPYVYEFRDPSPIVFSELVRSRSLALAKISRRFLEIMERYVAKGAKHTIVTNKFLGKRLSKEYGILNWSVLYGSTLGRVRPKDQKGHANGVLALVLSGTLTALQHDLETLLEAMNRLTNDGHNVKLRIVGSVADDLMPLVVNSAELVEILGWKNRDEYMSILSSSSDAGVIPYGLTEVTESRLPNRLFDYMAAGLPTVAAALPGLMEIVTDGVNGLLYTPGSAESLYEALVRLYDSNLRAKLGREAEQKFNSLFCEEVQMDKFKSIIKCIIQDSPLGRRDWTRNSENITHSERDISGATITSMRRFWIGAQELS